MAKETKQVLVDKELSEKILIIAAHLKVTRQHIIDEALRDCIRRHKKFFT